MEMPEFAGDYFFNRTRSGCDLSLISPSNVICALKSFTFMREGVGKFLGLIPKQQTSPTHPIDLGLKGIDFPPEIFTFCHEICLLLLTPFPYVSCIYKKILWGEISRCGHFRFRVVVEDDCSDSPRHLCRGRQHLHNCFGTFSTKYTTIYPIYSQSVEGIHSAAKN